MNKKNYELLLNSFSLSVGAEIARLRRDKGLSGEQLGNLIGVSQQQISRYECGICQITTMTLCVLLRHLEVSLEHFFYRVAVGIEKEKPSLYAEFECLFEKDSDTLSLAIKQETYTRFE
ncbi:helix-turn-helix domain-containing protein [Providencia burhodogranariea]|uniref:Fimbrial operon regulator n=1 Tax=Providencia burhodogranariea DSM 19968 TaxID=1141662 RepID=K8WQ17_9GAMM|nr:helix-turn-helix transcriptional regulator [Providencia burhodogranariea]EKT62041.1 fimbrial operon regulator [Providencia burhodogranariea DSM 19968]